jgi:hypothetical protein
MVVVVVPADTPMSRTLSEYLTSRVDPMVLQRTTFVLTKMANVDLDERERLVSTFRRRIEERLGIDTPVVHAVSLRPVIENLRGQPTDLSWVRRFDIVARTLSIRAATSRSLAISDSSLRLAEEALESSTATVRRRRSELAARRRQLDDESIPELPSFVDSLRDRMHGSLADAAATAESTCVEHVESLHRQARRAVSEHLAELDEKRKLAAFSEEELGDLLQAVLSTAVEWSVDAMNAYLAHSEVVWAEVFAQLNDAYARVTTIERVEESQSRMSLSGSEVDPSDALADAIAASGQVGGGGGSVGAAVAGGALGLVVLGPIGAMIGAGIGSWLSEVFGPSVTDVRTTVQAAADRALEDALREQHENTLRWLRRTHKERTSELDRHLDKVISSYAGLVQSVRSAHDRESEDIGVLESRLGQLEAEFAHRREEVAQSRRELGRLDLT